MSDQGGHSGGGGGHHGIGLHWLFAAAFVYSVTWFAHRTMVLMAEFWNQVVAGKYVLTITSEGKWLNVKKVKLRKL